MYVCIYVCIYKLKSQTQDARCARVNIKQKNTFSVLKNISVVLHNLLQCV